LKKRVLVNGCSFTNKKYESPWYPNFKCKNVKMWYEHLCDEFGWEVKHNLAVNGNSNDLIVQDTIYELYNNNKEYDAVIIGLSNWWRIALPYWGHKLNLDLLRVIDEGWVKEHNQSDGATTHLSYSKLFAYDRIYPYEVVKTNLLNMLNLVRVCKLFNKELILFQILMPLSISAEPYRELVMAMTESSLSERLQKEMDENFRWLGWPVFEELKGISACADLVNRERKGEFGKLIHRAMPLHVSPRASLQAERILKDIEKSNPTTLSLSTWMVGQLDGHANEKGHEAMGKTAIKLYYEPNRNI
tara:strand:+ start:357 stop:1262 length:906 start_codon:yes stop_codon:yes gene_type:complete